MAINRSAVLPVAFGSFVTVTASDTIDTGLKGVVAVVAQLADTPVQTVDRVTAAPGSGGNIVVKSWMPTSVTSTLPAAATTFGKTVNWVAWGTY